MKMDFPEYVSRAKELGFEVKRCEQYVGWVYYRPIHSWRNWVACHYKNAMEKMESESEQGNNRKG